ncbi:MAG: LysM peptidoglycan-binding domain-containing M23 family metallopeptidase [Brevinema sp.]
MQHLKLFLSETTARFPTDWIPHKNKKTTHLQSSKKFSLKTKNKSLPLLSLAIVVTTLLTIIFFNTYPVVSLNKINVGDSLLTDLIIDKEITQNINRKIIESKQELQMLAESTPLSFAFYRILPGENLSSVAQKFGLTMATVLSLNSLDNAHSLSVGQKILLSTRSGIIVNTTNKESIHTIAERHGISAEETSLVNALENTEIQEGTTLFLPNANLSFKAMAELLGFEFINPVPQYRRISSQYGWRRHPILRQRILHKGIDFAAPIGTPIVAPKEGRVVSAGWNGSFGLHTVIRHNNGFTTVYAHQSKIFVQAGQWVTTGQQIGAVGNTGRSTGPHLHFELHKYGQSRNPLYNGLQL